MVIRNNLQRHAHPTLVVNILLMHSNFVFGVMEEYPMVIRNNLQRHAHSTLVVNTLLMPSIPKI